MEIYTINEYQRKGRKSTTKTISFPMTSEFKGNDEVVVILKSEYDNIKQDIETGEKCQQYIDEIERLSDGLAKLKIENNEIKAENELLNKVQSIANPIEDQMIFMQNLNQKLENELETTKRKIEILEEQTKEMTTISLNYQQSIKENEKKSEIIADLKEDIIVNAEAITNLEDYNKSLKDGLFYSQHILELLKNRGLFERIINKDVSTSIPKPDVLSEFHKPNDPK